MSTKTHKLAFTLTVIVSVFTPVFLLRLDELVVVNLVARSFDLLLLMLNYWSLMRLQVFALFSQERVLKTFALHFPPFMFGDQFLRFILRHRSLAFSCESILGETSQERLAASNCGGLASHAEQQVGRGPEKECFLRQH